MYRWFVDLYKGQGKMDIIRFFSPLMLTLASFVLWFMPFVPNISSFLDIIVKPFIQKGVM